MRGFGFMMRAILDQQVEDLRKGVRLSNRVDVSRMVARQKPPWLSPSGPSTGSSWLRTAAKIALRHGAGYCSIHHR